MKTFHQISLTILLLVIFHYAYVDSYRKQITYRGNFNFKFKCGDFVPAVGRLQLSMWVKPGKSYPLEHRSVLFDTVLTPEDQGVFNRSLVSILDTEHDEEADHRFFLRFRTNCYILNPLGQCCAHDFVFEGRQAELDPTAGRANRLEAMGSWLHSNFWPLFHYGQFCVYNMTLNLQSCDPGNYTCMQNHLIHGDTVDLMDLLLNMPNYNYNITEGKMGKKLELLYVRRVCVPENFYLTWSVNFDEYDPWPVVCDPTQRYGLDKPSYEWPEEMKLQGLDVVEKCPPQ